MGRISSFAGNAWRPVLNAGWIALLCATEAMAEDPLVQFNVPSEPLPQALLDYYHQCGVEPGFSATPEIAAAKSQAVSGFMSRSTALTLLLQGTGYTYFPDRAGAVDIVPAISDVEPTVRVNPVPRTVIPRPRTQDRLELVSITGSLIPGVQEVVAPLVYLKQQELALAAYPTVQDSLYSLPLMSLNGPREDLGTDENIQYGSGLDLRGLGVGATLVLVNGHRQPLSGLNGDFVDVSTIPLSAVQRIEVLPEGASALYGSDAIAGVVNIIMRDDFVGSETHVRYGTAVNGRRETMAAQLIGKRWTTGHAMLAYEYSDTTPLEASARAYAANANKTPYGGGNYDSYFSNPGNLLNPSTLQPVYGIPTGQSGNALAVSALSNQINLANQFAQSQIFPDVTAHELYTSGTQEVAEDVDLFFEGRLAERNALRSYLPDEQVLVVPPSNPFYLNPFPGAAYTLVAYSFSRDYGPTIFSASSQAYTATVGARLKVGDTWVISATESYGRQAIRSDEYNIPDQSALNASLADSDATSAFDPFGDGSATSPESLAALLRNYPLHAVSTIEASRLIAEGSLFRTPAGPARGAVGVEHRQEGLSHDIADPLNPAEQTLTQSYVRHIGALFSQLSIPLLGAPNKGPPVPSLQLDLSGRYEHYSDFGNTFNPMVRVRWIPGQSLKLRATWGRSFRAPTLDDLYDTSGNAAGLVLLPDPKSATGRSLVLVEQGSNPRLRQETAKSWTAGIDIAPNSLPTATLSVTYYSIDYENRIAQPASDNPFQILVDGAEWSSVITRNPSPAQVAAVCNGGDYQGPLAGCLASSPAAIVDYRLANLAETKTTGLDLEAGDSFRGPWGAVSLGLIANYVLSFEQAVTSSSEPVDIANTVNNPLALRLRGVAAWDSNGPGLPGVALTLAVNYTGGYRNPSSTLLPDVSPWTTLDVRVAYRPRETDRWLHGLEFSLNAVNVLNHDPPFVDDLYGYDIYNVQALGRVVNADISKRW